MALTQTACMKMVDLLAPYSGATDVEVFIQKIDLISPQVAQADQPVFLTVLKLKLEGTAADYMREEVCPDLDTFIDLLRDRFQLLSKPEVYQAQLANSSPK